MVNQHAQRKLVESSLRLLTAIWVGAGLLLLLLTIYVVSAPSLDRIVLLTSMAATMTVSAVVLISGRHPGEMVAVMTAAALVSTFVTAPSNDGVFSLSVQWAALAALSAAFLLDSRYSILVVIAITVSAQALASIRLSQLGELGWGPFAIGVNNVGMGVGAALAVRVWRRLADEGDRVATESQSAQVDLRVARQRADYLRRFRNALHDTVMNTVGVIARGVPAESEPQLRRRATDDLAQMDARIVGGDHVADLVPATQRRAASLGLEVSVRRVGPSAGAVPQDVLDGMADCISEALLNASKHAAGPVSVFISESQARLRVTVVDSGAGVASPPDRLRDRARHDQIDVKVDYGRTGAVIRLSWQGRRATAKSSPPPPLARQAGLDMDTDPSSPMRTLASYIGVWVGGAYLISTIISLIGRWEPAGLLRLLGAALVGLAVVASPRIGRNSAFLIVLIAGIPVVSLPLGQICETYGIFASTDWAALVTMMVLLLAGQPGRIAAISSYVITNAVIAGYLLATTNCAPNFTANFVTNTFALFAMVLFIHRIDRFYSAVGMAQRAANTARLTAAAAKADIEHRRRTSRAVLAPSRQLLASISDGSARMDDPAVRAAAATEEYYLRSVDRITPELGLLADELLELMNLARRRDLRVDVDVVGASDAAANAATARLIGAALREVLGACTATGGVLRIVIFDSANAWLSIVTESELLAAGPLRDKLSAFDIAHQVHDLDGQTFVQFGGPPPFDD